MIANVVDTAGIISLLVGTILPLFVAYVVKADWNKDVKGLLLLLLAGVTAVLGQWLQALRSDVPFDWKTVVLSALTTFFVAVGAHYAIWRSGAVQEWLLAHGIKAEPVPEPTPEPIP